MAEPTISVVVVAYRQQAALADCLQSCLEATVAVPGGVELIVVDNGGLAPLIREHWPDVRLIESGSNVGFAGGVKRGVAVARGKWVALVNDDARIERDALARLLAAGERDERIGSIAAQVRFHSNPALINSAGIEVDSLGIATERLSGRPSTEAQHACEVFGASGCFALYRAAMFNTLGGLDERFFAYLEDVDLAWRARAAGWIAVYEPSAVAHHHGSASSGEGSQRKYFLVGRNRVRLLARNATTTQLMRALGGILLYDSAYVVYVALTDRTLAPLWGRLEGLREWRSLRDEGRAWRGAVKLEPATRGWLGALRQHRAYSRLGASS
ncbi:MAG: glycosyltransferase family 2 protein [Solirubrobacterales bacterium]